MSNPSAKPVDRYSLADDHTSRVAFLNRSANKHAAFFLPYLQPGMHLLDCGCGPGSITLGLAAVVTHGEVVGVDIDAAAIQLAQEKAEQADVTNVRFETGNAYELPFPDHSFDAVFSHALLMHLREPIKALQEMRRVLKPGGVVGIRNNDRDGLLISPADPLLYEIWDILAQFVASNGGDTRGAKDSRGWLHQAGFSRVVASASYEVHGTPEETAAYSASMFARAVAPPEQNLLVKVGMVTPEHLREIGEAWKAWGERPDAFFGQSWCEAVGWA